MLHKPRVQTCLHAQHGVSSAQRTVRAHAYAPGGCTDGPCQMVLLLQSFSCSVPVGNRVRLTGGQAAVALLLHTVLLVLTSTMLMVPLGLMTSLQGPGEVALVLYVTLPVLSVTVSVQLSLSVALVALLGAGSLMLVGPVPVARITVPLELLPDNTTGLITAQHTNRAECGQPQRRAAI